MGEMKIKLSDKVEKVFRRIAMQRFGYQKGAISEAAEDAIEEWTEIHNNELDTKRDPIEEISGLMKNLEESSVELQHKAWDFVIDKYDRKHKKKRKKKDAYR